MGSALTPVFFKGIYYHYILLEFIYRPGWRDALLELIVLSENTSQVHQPSFKHLSPTFQIHYTTPLRIMLIIIYSASLQSMAQFKWHDGTVKNVHVDPTLLFDYQVRCWLY